MQPEVIQGFRLSPQQKRLWLLGDNAAYHGQVAIEIEGKLVTEILKASLDQVIAGNEILRTTFSSLPGMKLPVQVVAESSQPSWRRVDLNGSKEETSVVDLLEEDRRKPFDLEHGPTVRCTLVCLATDQHMLLLTVPSLCVDSRSLTCLTKQIAQTYESCLREVAVDEENVQYVQFSEWQNELLEAEESQGGRDFWREQKLDHERWSLPLENQNAGGSSFRPAFAIETIAPDALIAAAQRHDVSLESLLFVCWQAFLARITTQSSITVNLHSDGRVYDEMRDAIGLYERSLPVQTIVSEGFTFSEGVRQAAAKIAEAREWQEYFLPNAEARESVAFSFDEWPASTRAGDVAFRLVEKFSCTERFKLKLACVQAAEDLRFEVHYDATLFSATSIETITRQFKTFLEHALQHPELPIGKLNILGAYEREQLLVQWNDTKAEFEIEQCLTQLFDAQVERTPDAEALVYEDESLSFHELNRRANKLAHYLQGRGVGPESRVAICLDRSIDLLVSVLGIWKAGAAYVPLDPMQPRLRLDFMIKDADARLVLSHSHLRSLFSDESTDVVYLDAEREQIDQARDDKPAVNLVPGNLAYMIYTSGSTGEPKGTMIEHRSVVNLLRALEREIYGPGESALRVSVNAPLAFDSSVKQIVQLLNGHALCILPEDVRRDGRELSAYLVRNRIDVFDCTPSQLRLLLDDDATDLSVKMLLVGGEAFDQNLWHTLAQQAATKSYNVYGPTECTVDATTCLIRSEVDRPTIGRPLANVQTYVLDARMQPAPIGATGELFIGGDGVARGYLGRPSLTAEKFCPNPFSDRPGSRLYRTGDLARYSASGNLEFAGRVDHQVKIRGSRIELGEIEAALTSHPAIREAVVVVRETGTDDKRLVAYLVCSQNPPSNHELHTFLRDRLPDYMMPNAFVNLAAFPLLPNGKIDRRSLPAPEQDAKEEEYVAPRTATETQMAEIWARVLGVKRVGISNNFFELGGHSLLATQVISQVRHAFEVEVPLRNIFETPTVAGLSASVDQARRTSSSAQLPELLPVPRDADLPLSFAQQRLWFLEQLDPANFAYNIPYAVRLNGTLNRDALQQSLTEIVRRHEVLRTTFATRNGQTVQIINPPASCELEIRDLHHLPDDERDAEARRMAHEEARLPFDLERGPLVRTTLLGLAEEQHVLLLTMHHIVFDAWSIGILIQEMGALYEAFSSGHASPLPELSVQYADFASWQTKLLQGETLTAHVDFWRQQLDGVATLELPTDRPRPAVQTFNGAHRAFSLPDSVTQGVYELSRREGVTLFMTLLAAFQVMLHRYTSQTDISVGTPIANRNYREIEGLIGFFINTLVLRTDLSGDPSFRELLQRVRDTALNAYAHQDLPFEKLVEELQPERNLGRTPFFQVLFTVRNIAASRLNVRNLSLEGLDIETGTSKFDLLLMVDETERGINFGFEYNTDLFDDETIERMAEHFQNLVSGIVALPDRPLSHLALLSNEEEQKLIYGWNDTARPFPNDQCVHKMFEEQVERTPDAVALVFEGRELTYRELNSRANQLAHHLKTLGVGPDVFVGLLLERSVEMMVSVLGVMKAGGAYAALDPAYPRERVAYMLENSHARVLLSQEVFSNNLTELPIPLVLVDADWPTILQQPDSNPASQAFSDNLVYVTYTSGSTGKPKGIGMPHRAVRNLLYWQFCETHLPPGARTLQFASLSFDVSFQDMFSTWESGGTLVLITGEMRRDIAALSQTLVDEKIDRLFIPAVALQQLAEGFCANDQISASLKKVIAGSEQLQITRSISRLFTELPDCTLHNEYGPSETHVVTELAMPLSVSAWPERPAVGKPIYNTQVYLLDPNMKPVPIGVSGEVFLGGAGVSRGYLGRPDLTAEKFIPDPFSRQPGERLYRTGDLGRWTADGNVVFLGRMDFQIKIRGFRVEPGEIEVALNSHAAIRETIVLAREDEPGKKRLVAYVVPAEGNTPTVSELRSFLLTTLPDYMVPSVFVFLDALPMTPNGKVNRKALPVPDQSRPELERAYVAPHDALEQVVAECWASVLGLERVGVDDDFFELGGHSLLATQVIGRLREVFPVQLPLRALFEAPTVAGLAERMANETGNRETLQEIAETLLTLSDLTDAEVEALLQNEQHAKTAAQ